MILKKHIAYFFFTVALCYIISPWFFEKKLLFNELLSVCGLGMLAYKRFKIERSEITLLLILFLCLSAVHLIVSLWRMDSLYYYLRNSVIVYSVFSFFLGYFTWKYLPSFIAGIRRLLSFYIGFFLLVPVSRFLFERFGMSLLFSALIQKRNLKYALLFLMCLCFIYAVVYSSATIMVLFFCFGLLLIIPSYKALKQFTAIGFLFFLIFFVLIQPDLALMDTYYSVSNNEGIETVMRSNSLLALDASTTWRFVFWRQAIVDQFPLNIPGLGFGTPLFKYYPVYDPEKLSTLPYVMGAHNSYVYLFARLGILYLLLLAGTYRIIFKEYFYFKGYYYKTGFILLFWSFFSISVIAFFNPVLESPVYASAYWLLLGFLAKTIVSRKAATL